jgi:hypothetical protein
MSQNSPSENETGNERSSGITAYLEKLQAKCSEIVENSLEGDGAAILASSRHRAVELAAWMEAIGSRKESKLFRLAAIEHEYALLALAQGHYRHAFRGLRLVLELGLQAVYLSKNELMLREWLQNSADTIWAAIIDEESGVFSKRVVLAFFPELEAHLPHYRSLAKSIYRECSESVHGNLPQSTTLPNELAFSGATMRLWHERAEGAMSVIHFAACLRYLKDLCADEISSIEPTLQQRLGHISEIRALLSGPEIP